MNSKLPATDRATLTREQKQLLKWLASQHGGVTHITDERLVESLIKRGMALKFYESDGGPLSPVWTITDAGRAALSLAGDKP